MSFELPRPVEGGHKVCQCPHCRRLITVKPEVLEDPLFFTKEYMYKGFSYKLPPFVHDVVSGFGGFSSGLLFAYHNLPTATNWAERVVPHTRARMIFLPLVAFPPLILSTALVAGLGKAILPSFIEITLEVFLGPSEAILGATNDFKKGRLVLSDVTTKKPT